MNYHHIPRFVTFLSSLSISSILWVCLLGLEFKKAIDNKFSALKLIEPAQSESLIPYQINDEMWDILAIQSFFFALFFRTRFINRSDKAPNVDYQEADNKRIRCW